MQEEIIRPSRRRMRLSFALAVVAALAVMWLYVKYREQLAWWVLLVALLPFAGAAAGWLDTRRMVLILREGLVRAEFGVWRTEVREIPAAKIVAVNVERSFAQRLYGVGTVVVEGAGPGERIVTAELDAPKRVAARIRDMARLAGASAGARELVDKETSEDE
jgi:uncharacterized membrane protein YdbT with pleckstrin-like domain